MTFLPQLRTRECFNRVAQVRKKLAVRVQVCHFGFPEFKIEFSNFAEFLLSLSSFCQV